MARLWRVSKATHVQSYRRLTCQLRVRRDNKGARQVIRCSVLPLCSLCSGYKPERNPSNHRTRSQAPLHLALRISCRRLTGLPLCPFTPRFLLPVIAPMTRRTSPLVVAAHVHNSKTSRGGSKENFQARARLGRSQATMPTPKCRASTSEAMCLVPRFDAGEANPGRGVGPGVNVTQSRSE